MSATAHLTALVTAAVAGVLALAVRTDPLVVTGVVVGAQLLLATGLAGASGAGRRGTWLVVAGAGVAGVVLVEQAPSPVDVGWLAPAAAGAVLASLVREMLRRDGRAGLVTSLATTATGGLLAVLLASWPVTESMLDGPLLACSGAAGVAVAAVAWAVPGPRGLLGPVGVLLAAVAGAVAPELLGGDHPAAACAVVAAVGGLSAVVALTATDWWEPVSREHVALVATVPLALAAPLVHVAARFAAVWT